MTELPAPLRVREIGPGRWSAPHPTDDPEGRDVVFSGQVLAQMILASSAAAGGKEVKSIHAIFARAGRYSAGPMELTMDPIHQGRAWASDTVTAVQGDRLLARALVLLNTVEPDLMRHSPVMPDVPAPQDCKPEELGVIFPGAESRFVNGSGFQGGGDMPNVTVWVKVPTSYDSVALNQAITAWSQPGLFIGAAMRPHSDAIRLQDAHKTLSTGVISHSAHFHDHGDVGEWLLFVHDGTFAGNGRVFGSGAVFTADGVLVSTFAQDAMVRRVEERLDPKSSM